MRTISKTPVMAGAGMLVLDSGTFPKFPYYEMIGDLISGKSVSTVVDTYKAKAQAAIDEVYKK